MAKKQMSSLDMGAFALVLIGALNWGLVGVGNFMGSDWNVVNMLLGSFPAVRDAVYVLVGLAAVYNVYKMKSCM